MSQFPTKCRRATNKVRVLRQIKKVSLVEDLKIEPAVKVEEPRRIIKEVREQDLENLNRDSTRPFIIGRKKIKRLQCLRTCSMVPGVDYLFFQISGRRVSA